jgi:phosphoribosylformylglycinamidine synthase II
MTTAFSDAELERHGISHDEYQRIEDILGREPNLTELGVFSVMWSEHCSYKSSRVHLKRLPTEGPNVLQGPGENAGIIDIGDGLAVAFKIESHNHPSYIEPFQGAATGVGGILRDIFTMGARPIATMNSLRFGPLHGTDGPKNQQILEGVVGGIAHYGNCFGVPTVGGEVYFSSCYSQNPLVNAFALGIFEKDKIFFGKATGVGNPVIYVGAKTGRDGIHGATMASAGFGEDAAAKRPNVQIADPFMEKLLLEACLEVMQKGLVVGIQDMGAAGLTCSSCEMGARAGTGIRLELDDVPQREAGMEPYEIMLSESQERMLLVAEPQHAAELFEVFHKWGLDAVQVGEVTGDGLLRVSQSGDSFAEIPNGPIADEPPLYERPIMPPTKPGVDGWLPLYSFLDGAPEAIVGQFKTADANPGQADYGELLQTAVATPNLSSRRWIWEQYDHMVQSNTMVGPGSDAAVIRVKGTDKALAMVLDGPAVHVARNPREGARKAVAEACRNLVCSGARPVAATNCLNFGNPEHPEVMWQFSEVVDGLTEACEVFETPITGGNVSFYNETFEADIYPTPVIGIVGIVEDLKLVTTSSFQKEGDRIVLIERASRSEDINLDEERALQKLIAALIRDGLIRSAHDLSEGGFAVALAESCFSTLHRGAIGAEVSVPSNMEVCRDLFAEFPSRVLISTSAGNDVAQVLERAAGAGLAGNDVGQVGGDRLRLEYEGARAIDLLIDDLEQRWRDGLPEALENRPLLK